MAEGVGRPERQIQHEDNAIEEAVKGVDLLHEDSNGPEELGRASSNHSHDLNETPRPQDDEGDRANQLEAHDSPHVFRCWHESSQGSEIEDFIYGELVYPFKVPLVSYSLQV